MKPASAIPYLTPAEARRIDSVAIEEFGMTGLVLMENAGRGCADWLEELGVAGPVTICCGKGNNGGDGFVLARHLELRGHRVRVLLCSAPDALRGDAASNFEILRKSGANWQVVPRDADGPWLAERLNDSDWVVDALLGTGTTGSPRPPLDAALLAMNASRARKFAVDLPSGLDAETGNPGVPTFQADFTATFVAPKCGFREAAAQPFLGQVRSLDIGVPATCVLRAVSATGS